MAESKPIEVESMVNVNDHTSSFEKEWHNPKRALTEDETVLTLFHDAAALIKNETALHHLLMQTITGLAEHLKPLDHQMWEKWTEEYALITNHPLSTTETATEDGEAYYIRDGNIGGMRLVAKPNEINKELKMIIDMQAQTDNPRLYGLSSDLRVDLKKFGYFPILGPKAQSSYITKMMEYIALLIRLPEEDELDAKI